MAENMRCESENQNGEPTKNAGYWVKLRHDRRMEGEGVSCSVLLASDYERGAYSDADWGDLELCDLVLINARSRVEHAIFAALPPSVLESMKKPLGRGYRIEPHVYAWCDFHNDSQIDWEIGYGTQRLAAGSRKWVERALEQAHGDDRAAGIELARIAVEESGILTYLAKRYPETD